MIFKLTKRLLTETDGRLLFKFAYNFGWKGMRAVQHFQKRIKNGVHFPAFNFISVTNNCNLKCQGCWVTPTHPCAELSPEKLHGIINESKKQGSYFFGILGGEPLLHKHLFEVMEQHPDCYFLLFTNGTLITDQIAAEMRRLGNVSPLISIEGSVTVSDQRRGSNKVWERTMRGLENCRKHRLVTGVATSVCKSNINDLATRKFARDLIDHGVHYLWYYIYRPVGPNPTPELALSHDEILRLRRFMVDIRGQEPLLVVDSYWNDKGEALCPAATGIGHHINPQGDVEPCPPIQFSGDRLNGADTFVSTFVNSEFLKSFRQAATEAGRGCIIMENPDLLMQTVKKTGAADSSGRHTGCAELEAMTCRVSHHLPGHEIPEKYWPYRIAKKYWFFGFGAYG